MRILLRSALTVSVVAGALMAATPAHAKTVCWTASNGGQVCQDGSGGVVPRAGNVGGGSSDDVALPPPPPARPAPAPAPVNLRAAPAPMPAVIQAPAAPKAQAPDVNNTTPVPSASATPSPPVSMPAAEPSSTDPAQVERATEANDSPAAFFGVLAIVLLGGAITWW
jgi:hypothetical protein